jgi:hypothetical protein
MPQGDPQQHDTPGDMNRTVIAAAATMLPQPFEESGIGNRLQKLFHGGQAGVVLQAIPSEQRLGEGNVHEDPP